MQSPPCIIRILIPICYRLISAHKTPTFPTDLRLGDFEEAADDREPSVELKINAVGLPTINASNNVPDCSLPCRAHVTSHVKNLCNLKLKKGLFAFGFGLISADEYEMQHKQQHEKDAAEAEEMREHLSVQRE